MAKPTTTTNIDLVELVRAVSSLSTQVKIMWGIGAAIILAVLGGAWGLSGTMAELNRSIGTLQGKISASSDTNKTISDQLKVIIDELKTVGKTGELTPRIISPGIEIMKGGQIGGSKDVAQMLSTWPEHGDQIYVFTPNSELADEWKNAGALKAITELGIPVEKKN